MRGVSKGFRRAAALLALLTLLVTQAAVAADRDSGRGWRDRFEQVKRFVVTLSARLVIPPGSRCWLPAGARGIARALRAMN